MISELIFATNNNHKLAEINEICDATKLKIISLQDAGINIDIEEPYNTLHENAAEKCRVIYELTHKNCFAEDTGLEIAALNGEPGVRSARYAGSHGNSNANMDKVLAAMQGELNRKARFRTVIAFMQNATTYYFEGICNGTIAITKSGTSGFGYDPIFIPDGYTISFAELDKSIKSNISHRKLAFEKLSIFLNTL